MNRHSSRNPSCRFVVWFDSLFGSGWLFLPSLLFSGRVVFAVLKPGSVLLERQNLRLNGGNYLYLGLLGLLLAVHWVTFFESVQVYRRWLLPGVLFYLSVFLPFSGAVVFPGAAFPAGAGFSYSCTVGGCAGCSQWKLGNNITLAFSGACYPACHCVALRSEPQVCPHLYTSLLVAFYIRI
ncbi:MAG: hypothetical protein H6559_35115 [Lewinellaceae bacterium]|nr:hypothetical protein [Lewinellaceae bacterium]